ncbi:hypothetical protein OY671_004022 [Metschnikowia pulcherrima]|nr:hypothetical protein OY671_004022 [Metschnikowia pulcherrima]
MFHEHIPPPGSNTRGAVPSHSSHSPLNPADHRSLLHSVTSPTQSYSHDPALHNNESAPAMSAASSNISDTSHGANKRPVALELFYNSGVHAFRTMGSTSRRGSPSPVIHETQIAVPDSTAFNVLLFQRLCVRSLIDNIYGSRFA